MSSENLQDDLITSATKIYDSFKVSAIGTGYDTSIFEDENYRENMIYSIALQLMGTHIEGQILGSNILGRMIKKQISL